MIRRFVPKPVKPKQHPAVDHLAKFVADELILDPKGFSRLSALTRIYWDWAESHEVVHRRYQVSLLLLDLERSYGLTCGRVYLPVSEGGVWREGKQPTVYALRGARLKHPALNGRAMPSHEKGVIAKVWMGVVDGLIPDRIDGEMRAASIIDDDDVDDEEIDE